MDSRYNIKNFIDRIKDTDYIDVVQEVQQEIYRAESGTSGVKGAVKKRQSGALEYADELKGLAFFLGNGIKPFGLRDDIFYSFKPIFENLVNKKQMKPEILEIFNKN